MKDILYAEYHSDTTVKDGFPYPTKVMVKFTDGSVEIYTEPRDLIAVQNQIFLQQRALKP